MFRISPRKRAGVLPDRCPAADSGMLACSRFSSNNRVGKRLGEPTPIAKKGWRYHHVGIPTLTPRPGEVYVPHLLVHLAGFQTSPCGIQWMRFEPDAPYPEVVKTLPHVAFEVDDLATALLGQEILIPPNRPSAGVKVAMILDHGAPIELMEFSSPQDLQGE